MVAAAWDPMWVELTVVDVGERDVDGGSSQDLREREQRKGMPKLLVCFSCDGEIREGRKKLDVDCG